MFVAFHSCEDKFCGLWQKCLRRVLFQMRISVVADVVRLNLMMQGEACVKPQVIVMWRSVTGENLNFLHSQPDQLHQGNPNNLLWRKKCHLRNEVNLTTNNCRDFLKLSDFSSSTFPLQ